MHSDHSDDDRSGETEADLGSDETEAQSKSSRSRRDRDNIAELLIEAGIVEFGAHGFRAASTTAIARRADAHQPQINYHFSSKIELWRAVVDRLFAELDDSVRDIDPEMEPVDALRQLIEGLVGFAARRPQLNQIIVSEAMAPSDRLDWIIERYGRVRYQNMTAFWKQLQATGLAAPIDANLFYYVLIGSTALPFINRHEAEALLGTDMGSPEIVERHIEGLVATFLPGLSRPGPPATPGS